jgi:hypothetical protein
VLLLRPLGHLSIKEQPTTTYIVFPSSVHRQKPFASIKPGIKTRVIATGEFQKHPYDATRHTARGGKVTHHGDDENDGQAIGAVANDTFKHHK